jgi:DNA-binding LacI/PurR family transcriptional regulator
MARTRFPPTISDVARRAGVSIATVSRVINGTALVVPETEERIRTAIDDLHYVPRAAARGLASRRTDTLGLLLPEIGGAFFPPLLRGIEAEARAAGFDLLIHATTHIPHASAPAARRSLAEHNTDGLIVFTQSIESAELSRLHRIRFPVVLLYQTAPASLDIPAVLIENRTGARQVVQHLIEAHGCRRIAFLQGPPGNEDSGQRQAGYGEALEANGIPLDSALVGVGGFNEEEAHATIQQWLTQGAKFDAVFAGDDDAAAGVLSALRHARKRVPQDIKVVGFDDLPVARFLSPPLTTVRAPIETVGREAVRLLIRLIRGQRAQRVNLMPTELVVRESCGCVPEGAEINDRLQKEARHQ